MAYSHKREGFLPMFRHKTWLIFMAWLLALVMLPAPCSASGEDRLLLVTESGPPFNFLTQQGPAGYSVDIVRELLRRTEMHGEFHFLPWARAYNTALTQPDTLLFTISHTPERHDLFQWVGPVMYISWALYAKPESNLHIHDMDDARMLSGISVYRSDVREQYLRDLGFVNLHVSPAFSNSVQMMLGGRVPAVIADEMGIRHQLKRLGQPRSSVERVFIFKTMKLFLAFSKTTDPDIVARWRRAFEAMRRDGTLARIHARWDMPANTLQRLLALPEGP